MNPVYYQAKFISSAPRLRDAPPDQGLEVAFAGRSNAGKSSAINALTRQSQLARISKTPGRTQMLNFFEIGTTQRLVDLPGYGFAKVPLAVKEKWQKMMEDYLHHRKTLCGLIAVMDARHPLMPFDQQLLLWTQARQLPLHIILTKADKLSYSAGLSTLIQVKQELSLIESPISVQLFSSLKKQGIEELHAVLDQWFQFSTISISP
ncbi:MAG: hypothetical protein RL637_795 [Pseudomonadota bacterium]|jgi:GTP-binding protein